MLRSAALALALAAFPAGALAQWPQHGAPSGWREVFDADGRTAIALRQDGLRHLIAALLHDGSELDGHPSFAIERALIRFERARRRRPDDPELAYYTAIALSSFARPAPDGSIERREDEAEQAWRRVRALDPSFQAGRVAFELGAVHMRRHEFAEALAEYEAALAHAVAPTVRVMDYFYLPVGAERTLASFFLPITPDLVHGNLAEAAMLVGRLDDAIEHYRAAVETTDRPETRVLALWGLALATDRDGDHDGALRFARRAIQEDPVAGSRYTDLSRRHGPLAILHLDGVFFEPPYELHAYEALGHEAMARDPAGGVDAEELRRALVSWRFFLAEGGNASRYAATARRHAARLEAELAADEARRARRRRAP